MMRLSTIIGGVLALASTTSAQQHPPDYHYVVMAHGIIMPIAFVLFYPLGAIVIRLSNFRGAIWVHAGWMLFTYMLVLGGFGMGLWMAIVSQQINTYHPIIGIVVVGCLLLQPVTGLVHHLLYKRRGKPNAATYPHVWWGRAIITLGIINGGFGLQLSSNTTKGEIAYGVVAGFFWLLWMIVILVAFIKSRRDHESETGEKVSGPSSNGSIKQAETGDAYDGMRSSEPMRRSEPAGEPPLANGSRRQ